MFLLSWRVVHNLSVSHTVWRNILFQPISISNVYCSSLSISNISDFSLVGVHLSAYYLCVFKVWIAWIWTWNAGFNHTTLIYALALRASCICTISFLVYSLFPQCIISYKVAMECSRWPYVHFFKSFGWCLCSLIPIYHAFVFG